MEPIHRIMHLEQAEDFVIATRKSNNLEDFVAETFKKVNLLFDDHCIIDEKLK